RYCNRTSADSCVVLSPASADWARGPCGGVPGHDTPPRVYYRSSPPFLGAAFFDPPLPFSEAAAAAAAASALEGEGSSSGSYARNEPTSLRRASFSPFSMRYVSDVTRIRAVTRLVRRSSAASRSTS